MNLKIAVLSGDGVGPEVILQAKKALYAISVAYDHEFIFEDALIGAVAIEKTRSPLPEQTLNLCLNTDAVLFGAIGNPKYDNDPEAKIRPEQGLLKLRKELGLYANIRPIKPFKNLLDASPIKKEVIENVDFVVFRELTGGSYYGEKILNEEEFDKLSLILDNDIRHLVSMLDNTLLWAREQIHVLKVNKIPFDLHSLAEDVLELYHQPIQDKYLSVKNNIPPSTEVISDKEIIHTALRNFISNAIKFTPLGTSIEINAEQKNGAMYITVKDEGVGISKEILNKINRKEFVSTRGTNNEKGTGLGLMFTEDLISKLGEELYIETQAGKGTAITFTIHKQDTTAS